jgi:hypothetical protein
VADALYWSCVTITTIGFGDRYPTTKAGKIFTICYCLIGIGLMAKAVTDLASYPFLMREKKTELQVLMQFGTDLSEEQLKQIQDHELINAVPKLRKKKDRVEKSEFVLILLQLMDKIQDTDIVYISEIFDALDKTGDGEPLVLYHAMLWYTLCLILFLSLPCPVLPCHTLSIHFIQAICPNKCSSRRSSMRGSGPGRWRPAGPQERVPRGRPSGEASRTFSKGMWMDYRDLSVMSLFNFCAYLFSFVFPAHQLNPRGVRPMLSRARGSHSTLPPPLATAPTSPLSRPKLSRWKVHPRTILILRVVGEMLIKYN